MNKLLPFLVFAAFALVACSEDKPDPSQSEVCTKPITKKCLIGNWYLDKVEGGYSNCNPNTDKENSLKLESNGRFSFIGSYDNFELDTKGTWELNETGTGIKIDCDRGTCDERVAYPVDASIDVRNSGRLELRINTKGYTGFLQCSVGSSSTDFTEVFVWRGR